MILIIAIVFIAWSVCLVFWARSFWGYFYFDRYCKYKILLEEERIESSTWRKLAHDEKQKHWMANEKLKTYEKIIQQHKTRGEKDSSY